MQESDTCLVDIIEEFLSENDFESPHFFFESKIAEPGEPGGKVWELADIEISLSDLPLEASRILILQLVDQIDRFIVSSVQEKSKATTGAVIRELCDSLQHQTMLMIYISCTATC